MPRFADSALRVCLSLIGAGIFPCLELASVAKSAEPSLAIYFIDVQGGAATLITTPEKESVLIDSGWPGQDDRDPKRIEHVIRNVAGLDHLDHLVTTHWHMDHFGGVESLSKRVRIDRFWDRGLPNLDAPDQDSLKFPDGPKRSDPLGLAYRKVTEGKRSTLKPGDLLPLKGKLEALVLASGGETLPGAGPRNSECETLPHDLPHDPSDNALSLALRFRLGTFTFLDCGDLTWNVERKLVCPSNVIGQIDLFQVTHHGMAISNHPTLLKSIKPTVAVINNGPSKGGDAALFQRLTEISSIEAIYQLHKNESSKAVDNTDTSLIANPTPEGGEFIKVVIDADGSHFEVQIAEKGRLRRFEDR